MKQIEDFANLLINPNGTTPINNCLLYLNDLNRNIKYSRAFGHVDTSINQTESNYRFRTGSITKTFTATIILQLKEEGLLHLDDLFLKCLKNSKTKQMFTDLMFYDGINYSNLITIKHLLQHKSGLRDYFADDERFFKCIMDFPNQKWEWKTIINKYFEFGLNKKGLFKPGTDFYYSDTNYLLLAVLIEELTNLSFHEVLNNRILTPLSLNETYLEFFQEPKGILPVIFPFNGTYSLKNINTSFDWGGGGIISSANDLDIFIRSLLTGKLFKKAETLELMMTFDDNLMNSQKKRTISYGIGLQRKIIEGHHYIGHNSAYGGMMFYNLDLKVSIIISINQVLAPHKAEWLMNKIIEFYNSK